MLAKSTVKAGKKVGMSNQIMIHTFYKLGEKVYFTPKKEEPVILEEIKEEIKEVVKPQTS